MGHRSLLLVGVVAALMCGCAVSVDSGPAVEKADSFSSSLSILAPGEMAHENLRLIWRASLNLGSTRRAYMAEDAMYVEDYAGHLISIDLSSGAIRWQHRLPFPLDFAPCFQNDDIYVLAGSRLLVLNKFSGLEERRRVVRLGVVTDPACIDEWLLVASTRNSVHGVDLQSGNAVWKRRMLTEVISVIALPPEHVIATTDSGEIAAFQIGTGEFTWRYNLAKAPVAPPVLVDGMIYLGNSDFYLYVIDARRGSLKWKAPYGGVAIQRPVLVGGRIYLVIAPGSLVAMDLESKKVIWETVGVSEFLTTINNRIYARSESGDLLILDAVSGNLLYTLDASGYRIGLAKPDEGIVYLIRADGVVAALADVGIPYVEKPIIGR